MNEFEMAAYVDRRLATPERERAEGHLAGCADCRQELVEVRGLLNQAARPRRFILGASLLAAAAALVLMVRSPAVDPVRDGGGPATLVAYGPTGEAPLTSLRFIWGAAPGVASYRLTVSGADGAPVWSRSVTDTVAVLPDSVALRVNQRYLWVADALLEDGSSRSTGLREFRPMR